MTNQPSPTAIRTALDEILPGVQKPSRYLGLERNLVRKAWDTVSVRVALAFPDAYEIGMSHQGSRILYHLINRRDDALAERTYAPMPDMAQALREAQIPLYTLESYRAVGEFDLVGISLQSELNYINVPYLLDLSGIARRASDRSEDEPIVLGGGPCTANPEPVADFFDAILIGDGEAALDEILDTVRDGRAASETRTTILQRLAKIRGVYVPRFYQWQEANPTGPASWQKILQDAPLPVSRVWVDRLDPADQPETAIVPFADVIQDRLGMEIMRGCTQGCRFCQAGYWYRPVREHDPEVVVRRIESQVAETGFEEVGLLSLSTADYSQVEPLVSHLSEKLQDRRVSVSLPSLRADAFSVGLAESVSRVRKSGFTFAPETGSDRLRRVINKTFTNAEMVRAAEAAFARGWNLIKVYAMIGLPTETDEDLEELALLTEDILRAGRRVSARRVEVKVSVGCFIPKAWTPFQWQPFTGAEELYRRIHLLKQRFRRIRGARLQWSNPEEAALETLLSRGGRSLSATIERAHALGAVFDGWSDHLDLEAWRRAIDETGIDLPRELGRREMSETLPWDVIDAGVRKGFLKAEWRRAERETETEDCKWGHCFRCGIPGDGADTQLASATLPVLGCPQPKPDIQQAAYRHHATPQLRPSAPVQAQLPVYRRFRFLFCKKGSARFLSHRQLMDAFERILRAVGLPVRFTEGFNPHIRLSMGPALAVGHQGEAEGFDVDCTAPVRPQHIERANQLLPEGVVILDARPLLPGAPSLGKLITSSRYRIDSVPDHEPWPESADGFSDDIRGGIRHWQRMDDGSIRVELNLRQDDGPVVSTKQLLAAFGLDQESIPRVGVTREMLVLSVGKKEKKPVGDTAGAAI
ncbi:MAG: TIGR03960 family B12-binding radical SAM protein [Thermoanaerobaculales bacterium]